MHVTAEQIREAIHRTGEARERVRQHRRTDAVITALAQTAENWLEPNNPWRKRAIEQAPATTGFSEAMVREAIDLTFGSITYESLGELLDRELGNRNVLDEFCLHGHMKARATGPRLIAHFLAGNVPAPGIVSICCGLLLRSANLVKTSSRDPVFPTLFVESLREVDGELADCVATLDWRRDELALTQAALADTDAVIAYGDDETVSAIREAVLLRQGYGGQAKFLGYGHKVSLAVVAKEAMTEENLPGLAAAAAFDASVYDQQGCMSPHVFYVEEGGQLGPHKFAAALADAMAAYQTRVPRGPLSVGEAAQVAKFRSGYEFRAASDKGIEVWSSEKHSEWTVIYDDNPVFSPSCLNRVVFVKPVENYKRVLDSIQSISTHISTVGVAPMNERATAFAAELARMGVPRVCPIGRMQRPPLASHHDGRGNLVELVGWTDAP